jgi:formylglycine-generating enzyme required for sulfatase activity
MRRWAFAAGAVIGAGLVWTVSPPPVRAQDQAPGTVFRDCATVCPEMVVIPAGSFVMGSPAGVGDDDERPQRTVTIGRPFAVGRFEVTYDEWDACVSEGYCRPATNNATSGPGHDEGWGRGRRPVINVSWNDAEDFVNWLSGKTGQRYRLLTESEWEYAARAGTTSRYSMGDAITADDANFAETGQSRTMPAGSFAPNAFGLYDMHGNVGEWVQDCYDEGYFDAPINGGVSISGDCSVRVLRGGSWDASANSTRSAFRNFSSVDNRLNNSGGFRVARSL